MHDRTHAPPVALTVTAERTGYVRGIDRRRLPQLAKLAGARGAPIAGLDLHVELGDNVQRGMPMFTLHAESPWGTRQCKTLPRHTPGHRVGRQGDAMKLGPTWKTPLVGPVGWLKSLVRLIYLNQNQKAVRTSFRIGCKVVFRTYPVRRRGAPTGCSQHPQRSRVCAAG